MLGGIAVRHTINDRGHIVGFSIEPGNPYFGRALIWQGAEPQTGAEGSDAASLVGNRFRTRPSLPENVRESLRRRLGQRRLGLIVALTTCL